MSYKQKEIDKLIQEVMDEVISEKTLPVSGFSSLPATSAGAQKVKRNLVIPSKASFAPGKKVGVQVKVFKNLLKLDGSQSSLTDADIEAALRAGGEVANSVYRIMQNTTDDDLKSSIQSVISKISGTPKAGDTGTVGTQPDDTAVDVEDIQSLTFPRVMNSDSAQEAGKFLGSQNELINSVFTQPTISGRLEEMSKISKSVMETPGQAEDGSVLTPRKTLQYSMFVDLVNFYVNESDSRSGGYNFEALCAVLCGGSVTGGENGVADFQTANGNQGSSKLYSKYAGITQAAANFKQGESVHYVIGMLDKADVQGAKKTIAVRLNYVIVTMVGTDADGKLLFVTSDANGNALSYQVKENKKGTKVDVVAGTTQEQTEVGVLKLYSDGKDKNSFKQQLDSQLDTEDTKTAQAYKAMKEFFATLFKAEESTKEYVAMPVEDALQQKATTTKADEALLAYDKADTQLVSLLQLIAPESDATVRGDRGSRKLTKENKQKTLDKLIEEVILKSTQEGK